MNSRTPLVDPLTPREQVILRRLSEDRSNAEIAAVESLAVSSVKWYVQQICSKLGVKTRHQAVTRARELGLLEGGGQAADARPEAETQPADSLPTGTVTFLFTDIEGSTPLWEQMPEAMVTAVAQHHRILRQAIEANGGQVFQVIGDAFQAAFRLASDALCAALAAQQGLKSAGWGPVKPIRVRMGLHTGPAERDPYGNAPYAVSHTLNRAARVMASAHGGQIVMTQETAALVEVALPDGVRLRDLGEHHLKGMQRLEHIYQVTAPGMPKDFPPLFTTEAARDNLPRRRTPYVGRAEAIALVQGWLEEAPLVTLTGSGGIGKTSLSIQVAEASRHNFPDGAWLVEPPPASPAPARLPLPGPHRACGGANIALRLAGEYPTLLRGIIAHEPALFSLVAGDPSVSPMLEANAKMRDAVVERIASGDHSGAAEQFFTLLLGPGAWQKLPPAMRQAFITNAPTFPNEVRDPERFAFDPDWVRSFSRPAFLSAGDQSPPFVGKVLSVLAQELPNCEVVTFAGAGHLPHVTNPEEYIESVGAFIRKHSS